MKIECGNTMLRIWLSDIYAIHKLKGSNIYILEYYRLGTDHMPDEIYSGRDLFDVYKKYEEIEGIKD